MQSSCTCLLSDSKSVDLQVAEAQQELSSRLTPAHVAFLQQRGARKRGAQQPITAAAQRRSTASAAQQPQLKRQPGKQTETASQPVQGQAAGQQSGPRVQRQPSRSAPQLGSMRSINDDLQPGQQQQVQSAGGCGMQLP